MFKAPGNFDCTITDAFVSEPNFGPREGEIVNSRGQRIEIWYDVCLLLKDEAGNTDVWRGEMSNRDGFGNRAHMQRWQITLETLRQIGFNVNTIPELAAQFIQNQEGVVSIPNLVNLKCTAVVEASNKVSDKTGQPYYNIKYITRLGGAGPKKLSMAEIMQRSGGAMMNASAAPAVPPPAAAPATPSAAYAQPAPAAAPVPPPPAAPAAPASSPDCPY